jgi:hypothetical protein
MPARTGFSRSVGEKPGTPQRERLERACRASWFRAGARNEGKIARDSETCDLRNVQRECPWQNGVAERWVGVAGVIS